jgi:Ca2+-binding EF-hand superfamily protein
LRNSKYVPEDGKDFIVKLLTVLPSKRLTASEANAHRFLARGGSPFQKEHAILLENLLDNNKNNVKESKLDNFAKHIIQNHGDELFAASELKKESEQIFGEVCEEQNIKDGILDYDSFKQAVGRLQKNPITPETLKELFQEMDIDNNKKINFDEFLTHCVWSHQKQQDKRMAQVIIQYLDPKKNGFVDLANLNDCFKHEPALKEHITKEFIEHLKSMKDKDGHLDFNTFLFELEKQIEKDDNEDYMTLPEKFNKKNK